MSNGEAKRAVFDELIEASQGRIADLEDELQFERRYLADLRARRAGLSKPSRTRKKAATPRPAPSVKGTIEPGSLTEKIVNLLQERGQPMRAAEIRRVLEGRGVATTSKNGLLPMVLSSLSRRKDVFSKVARGEYALKEQEADEPASES